MFPFPAAWHNNTGYTALLKYVISSPKEPGKEDNINDTVLE
tara:strand:+ start:258 stop:380 length:123 start_codon:yes stop_codon:yes gene_type:complete